MRRSFYCWAVAAALWLRCGAGARAADYTLTFDAGSAKFVEAQSNNRDSIARTLSLVQDYGGKHGIQFVLLGELPADCMEDFKCPDARLLRRRVEAVIDYIRVQSGSANVAQALRWQSVAQTTHHVEGVRLRVRDFAAQTFSPACPYRVRISDPQLPKTLSSDDADQDWVTVIGNEEVPVSEGTSVRIYSGAGQSAQTELAADQLLDDHKATLSSGADWIQWSVAQFKWEDGSANVVVHNGLVSRDIGNEILSWNTDSSIPTAPVSDAGGCKIGFRLLRPRF